jgi:hydroxyethylthiazole kinase
MFSSFSGVAAHLADIRREAPLVHNITNLVVMHTTANALLAVGASPVMAHAPEEMEEITGIAAALVLNIGTLSLSWIASMHAAIKVAARRGIPVVIDPVGAGASSLRTITALSLLAAAVDNAFPAILRGNASEILALDGAVGSAKGVDSLATTDAAADAAKRLASQYGCVVCVSGATDLIVNGHMGILLAGGSPLMTRVTGMGCSASALAGAVAALPARPGGGAGENATPATPLEHALWATVSAMAFMSTAGSMAAKECRGPGSFLPAFLDALYVMKGEDVYRWMTMERQSL